MKQVKKGAVRGSGFEMGSCSVHFSHKCSGCDSEAKSIRREFSDHVWSALVSWREIPSSAVDQPICNDCYFNLRDVLIDRADEIHLFENAKLSQRPASFSVAARA